ncbi:MAG TPA: hypothetical protein VLU99_00655 [Nitrososphaerales archaeon]|nr:hypothetical protein [Nitrososphaerales archaeon]
MQHSTGKLSKCALCGKEEATAGTFPMVIGLGRICLSCGMQTVRCDLCGAEVKRLTSSRFDGKTLCLKDRLKEVEKYKQHIVKTFDEDNDSVQEILSRSLADSPEGYSLITVRRARNSMHLWEAEYEKTEILQSRCG